MIQEDKNNVTMTKEELEFSYLNKLEAVFSEIAALESDVKDLKDEAKDRNLDSTLLAAMAKAKVQGKLAKIEDDCNDKLQFIERINNR